MANADEGAANGGGGGRGPRLPRWTRQEILVLIEGKRVVEGGGGGRGRVGRAVEPKWAAVSAYCRRHGVDRGPVQCRKRWSNLAGDYKKIKEWKGGEEAFWAMRNDVRREQRLPGFFDREVYDILDGAPPAPEAEEKGSGRREVVFDSGRTAADEGLFSDCDDDKDAAAAEEDDEEATEEEERATPQAASAVTPISEKKSEPVHHPEPSQQPNPGMAKDKHPTDNFEKGSPSREGHKRKRTSEEGAGDTNLQSQLIEVLEKNSRVLASHLEAQNVNYQLDRDQRKDHSDSLLSVLSKLADALGRIADKL